jgi:ribosomal protein S18 acetylase RimI-like enzyme
MPLPPNHAFLYDLYVYEAHRARGCGTLLMRLTLKVLADRGVEQASLWSIRTIVK